MSEETTKVLERGPLVMIERIMEQLAGTLKTIRQQVEAKEPGVMNDLPQYVARRQAAGEDIPPECIDLFLLREEYLPIFWRELLAQDADLKDEALELINPERFEMGTDQPWNANLARAIVCFCVNAYRQAKNGDSLVAWESVTAASQLLGWLQGNIAERFSQTLMRLASREGAHTAHAADRQIADDVTAWWIENRHKYRSQAQAAEVAAQLFSRSYRTVLKHISKAAKIYPLPPKRTLCPP